MSEPSISSNEVFLVFPNQLHRIRDDAFYGKPVVLVEDELFFTQLPFHRKKLIFHRAAMKEFEKELTEKGGRVWYIEAHDRRSRTEELFNWFGTMGVKEVQCDEPSDYLLERRLRRYATRHDITLDLLDSPLFLSSRHEIDTYFKDRKRYLMHDFYVRQRKARRILTDSAGQPLGGKWSFDSENRKRIPAGQDLPAAPPVFNCASVREAEQYVVKNFPDNPGVVHDFRFPVTPQQAEEALEQFLVHRFAHFGEYQDALVHGQSWLYHSLLSSSLNAGLITPESVIRRVLEFSDYNAVPINSVEGFIRQVIGWREYIRGVYLHHGTAERTRNYWGHTTRLPETFWSAQTGIAPLDDAISRTLSDAYTHHIDRLMVLGNFMLLCEFDPDEVYRWFMSMYIDAYDWVMVPNVYGMSQFADGGMMSTKPYISGSAYILRMSNLKKGEWTETWDALFWRFISVHRDYFSSNPRLSMMVKTLDKMDPSKRSLHLRMADDFLESFGGVH